MVIYQFLSILVAKTYGSQHFPVAGDGWICLLLLPLVQREILSGVSANTLEGLAESQSQELCSPSCVYATEALGQWGILITFQTDAFLLGWARY